MQGALEDAAQRRQQLPMTKLERLVSDAAAPRDSFECLRPAEHVRIIAEVKRASPSRGVLADIPDPAALARLYETGGASAISVLTEERKFGGSLDDLRAVRAAVDVPVLRKDFISNAYQVLEARAAGADMVLLIVAGLTDPLMKELFELITELGMSALVETHSADEVSRAIDLGANIVGVNARDLTTFELDQGLFGRLADQIPAGVIRIAESAVQTATDVARYRADGADVVLVGEALVTGDPVGTLASFLAVES
jgi:indole-3-glycerol phosphate synthase